MVLLPGSFAFPVKKLQQIIPIDFEKQKVKIPPTFSIPNTQLLN